MKEKDDRKKELVQSLLRQKELLVVRHRESEERRRGAVEQAVTDLLTRDTQYRQELKLQVSTQIEAGDLPGQDLEGIVYLVSQFT